MIYFAIMRNIDVICDTIRFQARDIFGYFLNTWSPIVLVTVIISICTSVREVEAKIVRSQLQEFCSYGSYDEWVYLTYSEKYYAFPYKYSPTTFLTREVDATEFGYAVSLSLRDFQPAMDGRGRLVVPYNELAQISVTNVADTSKLLDSFRNFARSSDESNINDDDLVETKESNGLIKIRGRKEDVVNYYMYSLGEGGGVEVAISCPVQKHSPEIEAFGVNWCSMTTGLGPVYNMTFTSENLRDWRQIKKHADQFVSCGLDKIIR